MNQVAQETTIQNKKKFQGTCADGILTGKIKPKK